MIDYDFYVNSYLGSDIPEKSFSRLVARAADALEAIRRRYRVVCADEVSEKWLCALWRRPSTATAAERPV